MTQICTRWWAKVPTIIHLPASNETPKWLCFHQNTPTCKKYGNSAYSDCEAVGLAIMYQFWPFVTTKVPFVAQLRLLCSANAHFWPFFNHCLPCKCPFVPFFAIFLKLKRRRAARTSSTAPHANCGCVFRLRLGLLRGAAPPEGLPLRFMSYLVTFFSNFPPTTPKLAPISPKFAQFLPLSSKFWNNMVTFTCRRTQIQHFFEMLCICHKFASLGGDFGDFEILLSLFWGYPLYGQQ